MGSKEVQKDKWAARVFIGYMAIGILPLFFYETEFNAEFAFAFKYLTLPFILLWYLLIATVLHKVFKDEHLLVRILAPLICGVICALGSGGYVSVANGVVGPQTPVTVRGKVVKKDRIGSRKFKDSYFLDIETSSRSGFDTVRLNVPKKSYDEIRLGGIYTREMVRGGLGFLYKKRW